MMKAAGMHDAPRGLRHLPLLLALATFGTATADGFVHPLVAEVGRARVVLALLGLLARLARQLLVHVVYAVELFVVEFFQVEKDGVRARGHAYQLVELDL